MGVSNSRFNCEVVTRRNTQDDLTMDAIRKKMQSLKGETDSLYATIQKFEDATKESNRQAEQADCDIRDFGKKVQNLEIALEEAKKSEQNLADTVTKLATCSKEADNILKKVKMGENMKSLEKSAEKAVEREEKLKDKILSIQQKYKAAEGRFEYGEMNITKLNQRIDDIEDEIYREKLKIKKCADDLSDTFDDMLAHY